MINLELKLNNLLLRNLISYWGLEKIIHGMLIAYLNMKKKKLNLTFLYKIKSINKKKVAGIVINFSLKLKLSLIISLKEYLL